MFNVGKNRSGVRVFVTQERFDAIVANPALYRKEYTSQQWAKIRKRINRSKREQSNG